MKIPFDLNAPSQPAEFKFSTKYAKKAKAAIALYPKGDSNRR